MALTERGKEALKHQIVKADAQLNPSDIKFNDIELTVLLIKTGKLSGDAYRFLAAAEFSVEVEDVTDEQRLKAFEKYRSRFMQRQNTQEGPGFTQPPSRRWLVQETRRKLWAEMVHLHGTSIDNLDENDQLSAFDRGMIREFGGYKNDPTLGNKRLKDGTIIQGQDDDDEGEEIAVGVGIYGQLDIDHESITLNRRKSDGSN